MPRYAELHCKTNFSFLRGASHPDELVARAAELGYAALAITDHNSLAGIVRAHVAAKSAGLKLIVGAEITPAHAAPVLLFAPHLAAYRNLSRLITRGRRAAEKGECHLTLDDVAAHADGLIAAVCLDKDEGGRMKDECRNAFILHPSSFILSQCRDIFRGRCYLAASLHLGPDDDERLDRVAAVARSIGLPLAATNDVHYHSPDRRPLHDVLTAIHAGCTVAELGARRFPNGERYLKSPEQMAALFARHPDAIAHALDIATQSTFSLDELRYHYPEELCPPGLTPTEHLTRLTWAGARERYHGEPPDKVRRLLEHELRIITELGYEAYFLTVWDLVEFARSRDILCQGRGSAANSAVCFCLGITAVDPDRTDVLFERFISRERNEPPDIDVDFEHERREEVMQYVYEKYGRDRAGIVAEVIRYRPRSAVRDVGKALGLSLDRVDRLAKSFDHRVDGATLDSCARESGLDPSASAVRQLLRLTAEIIGFPRHLSQHVGGFVITHGPLSELVPIENAAMPDRTVIQWDKDDLDAVGLIKVDCLALGMLTAIHKCLDFIEQGAQESEFRVQQERGRVQGPGFRVQQERKGVGVGSSLNPELLNPPSPLTLATIPPEDPAVYDMICRADTVGVFQVESRAQMSMLPRLKPRCFYDLTIEVAIVRPGPIQGGMVHPYLRRRGGEEPVTFPNESIRGVLEKTLGVPIFQEQVMRLAVVAAGFTPGEADQLRRAMGAWRRPGVIEQFRIKLRDGMLARGLPAEFADRLFEQIKGFGEYGFPESHAASFALLAYASAWLKHYHPAAFTAALLNSQPMGFYAPAQLVRDAQQHGVEVRPVDVNFSGWDCTLEPRQRRRGTAIRLGLRLVSGLVRSAGDAIAAARGERPFRSVFDLADRAGLKRAVLARLATADAFGSLGLDRRAALWQALAWDEPPPLFAGKRTTQIGLPIADGSTSHSAFRTSHSDCPNLPPMRPLEQVIADYSTVGLSLKAHPMSFFRRDLDALRVVAASRLDRSADQAAVRVAGLVLLRQQPGTAKGIIFMTLEDETGIVNLIVRPPVWNRIRRTACAAAAVVAHGTLQRSQGVVHVVVSRMDDLTERLGQLRSRSREFC
jgi:error-prone DNA polymerase